MCCAPFVFGDAQNTRRGKNKKKRGKHIQRQCNARKICAKKKTTAWKMKNKKQNQNGKLTIFFVFFFESAKSKNVSATRVFFPRPSRLSLVPQAKKWKAGKWVGGVGVGKNKTKIKQRLRNERRKPFTASCLRGFHLFSSFFLFLFFFLCTRTPNSNNSHLLWIFQRGVSKNSTSSNPVNQVNNMWVQRFPLNYVPGVLQRSFRLDEACARRRRSWKIA